MVVILRCVIPTIVSLSFMIAASGLTMADMRLEVVNFKPGIIFDPPNDRIYLMNTELGIDSITIKTGERLWRSDIAAKPLLLHEGILYAQRKRPEHDNDLLIVGINVDNPDKSTFEASIKLPTDVVVSVNELMASTFSVTAELCGHDMILNWFYRSRPLSGMGFDADSLPALIERTGIARINIKTGTVISETTTITCPQAPAIPPAIARLTSTETWIQKPYLLDDNWVALQSETDDDGRGIVLRRWGAQSGKALPTIRLFGNDLTYRYASADGRYLLASRVDLQGGTMDRPYKWSIFSMKTGKRITPIYHQRPAAWFLIHASFLVHEVNPQSKWVDSVEVFEPRKLQAIDLQTGKARWDYPVRDLGYFGPLPPGINK